MLGKKKLCALFCASLMALGTMAAGQAEGAANRALNGFFKQIHQQVDMGRDSKGEYELLRQRFAGLAVDAELRQQYPKLAAAIEARTQAGWQHMQKARPQMKAGAEASRQDVPEHYRPFYQYEDVLMRRADEQVVSYLETEATDTGGAHGMYGYQGVNLNPLSGEEIALSHVVKDTGKLTELIIERLKKEYPQAFFIDMEKNVRSYALQGKLNWTLDPRGISFYFNPYAVASYADGLLTVTILFAEEPQLFHEAYLQTVQEYAQPFPAYYPLKTSLSDNSRLDVVAVHEQGDTQLCVELNGQETSWDTPLTDLQPVLVHMKGKKNYLYIDGRTPEGKRQTVVFKLHKGKVQHVGTLPYTFRHVIAVSPVEQEYWRFLTNPNGFYFDRNATPGSTAKTDICAVGEDGLLTFG